MLTIFAYVFIYFVQVCHIVIVFFYKENPERISLKIIVKLRLEHYKIVSRRAKGAAIHYNLIHGQT